MPRLTSWEFTESLAFEHLEPDPGDETVRLLGMLLTLMANAHLRPRTPFTFEDFVPDPYGPSKAERDQAKAERVQAFAGIMASYAEHSKKRKAEVH